MAKGKGKEGEGKEDIKVRLHGRSSLELGV